MAKYIDKSAVVAEIERRMQEHHSGYLVCLKEILSFISTIEVKAIDLDNEATHYLLHEHHSPLNEIMHKIDLKSEMQYHKDIENSYKAGFEFGLKVNNPVTTAESTGIHLQESTIVYVVSRSEEHSDYVEEVFFDETKAQKYCDQFNGDNEYVRYITKVKVSL